MNAPAICLLRVEDVLAAAVRILDVPRLEAVRISIDERVSMAVLVLQQHAMIEDAGLRYPQADE